jgi:hypothetical protein
VLCPSLVHALRLNDDGAHELCDMFRLILLLVSNTAGNCYAGRSRGTVRAVWVCRPAIHRSKGPRSQSISGAPKISTFSASVHICDVIYIESNSFWPIDESVQNRAGAVLGLVPTIRSGPLGRSRFYARDALLLSHRFRMRAEKNRPRPLNETSDSDLNANRAQPLHE